MEFTLKHYKSPLILGRNAYKHSPNASQCYVNILQFARILFRTLQSAMVSKIQIHIQKMLMCLKCFQFRNTNINLMELKITN